MSADEPARVVLPVRLYPETIAAFDRVRINGEKPRSRSEAVRHVLKLAQQRWCPHPVRHRDDDGFCTDCAAAPATIAARRSLR